jgi:hypothetical protein
MIQENNPQEAFDNSKMSFFSNLMKRITGEVPLTDEEVESRRKDYWKCPKCGELNYLDKFTCWKCEVSRPGKYEHPGREELKKDLQKDIISALLWLGFAFFIGAAGVLITGYIYDGHRGTFPDFLTIAFAGAFVLAGVIMIIYWLIRKFKV